MPSPVRLQTDWEAPGTDRTNLSGGMVLANQDRELPLKQS